MGDSDNATIAGVIMIVVALIVAGYFGYDYYQKYKLRQDYGETIATMCVSPAGGSATLNNAPFATKPWKTVVIEEDKKHDWNGMLPDEAQAKSGKNTDVVVCVMDSGKATVGECPYASVGSGEYFAIRRMQYYTDLILFNAQTGKRIADQRVWGSAPGACPRQYLGSKNGSIDGHKPTDNDFYYVVMSVIWQ
jgi:hypothetical protein